MAKPYYNPAVAGATEDLNILALARLEMIGVHGAPKSFFITADMPLALGKITVSDWLYLPRRSGFSRIRM